MSATVRVLVRALSLIAVALTGWANNVRWGTSAVRAGPPAQWERIAVGAALLSALVALAVWIGTRSGLGVTRMWWRGAACLFAVGIVAIALQLRAQGGEAAPARSRSTVRAGAGWRPEPARRWRRRSARSRSAATSRSAEKAGTKTSNSPASAMIAATGASSANSTSAGRLRSYIARVE